MRRRRRNKLLVQIIGLGLLNFVAYTAIYAYIGGDARNGRIEDGLFLVRGHFLHGSAGHASEVSSRTWIYSYVHSVTIWPTIGLVLCSMLILSRPHIIATMREDHMISGQTFVTSAITAIILVISAATIYFVFDFIRALEAIQAGNDFGL